MAMESGIQVNNGSPKGYGQPRKKVPRSVIMGPQEDGVVQQFSEAQAPEQAQMPTQDPNAASTGFGAFGDGARGSMKQYMQNRNSGVAGGGGGNAPTTWANALGQYAAQNQNKLTPEQQRATAGLAGQYQQQQGQQQGQPSGLYDAFKQSTANGYTDIGDTTPWQTGQYMGQLQGFNTQGWGSGERGSGTLKNKMGQLLSNYDATQPGVLHQVMQDPRFQELTGGKATLVDHPNMDQIDFDGPDGPMQPVDLIGNATEGGAGTNWWWGTDTGGPGPAAPANQIYNQAIPGAEALDQQGILAQMGQTPGQAMEFLQWLMSQQQGGQLMNGGIGNSPVTF